MRGRRQRSGESGVTLLELVITISITSVLAGGVAVFITAPLEGFRDLSRRARLVDSAESALRRMSRDVRRALPNSVRIGAGATVLELLHVSDGARYRREAGTNPGPVVHDTVSDLLSFSTAGDDSWNAVGRFESLAFTSGVPLAAGTRLAIYTTSTAVYADAATSADPGLITPASTSITVVDDTDEDQVQLSDSFQFRFESPEQRFYVVDTPVTYLCDLASGRLTRFSGYAIAQSQPTDAGAPPLVAAPSARVAVGVSVCSFLYEPGSSQRSGLLTLELTVAEAGEQVRLLHQVQVENAP